MPRHPHLASLPMRVPRIGGWQCVDVFGNGKPSYTPVPVHMWLAEVSDIVGQRWFCVSTGRPQAALMFRPSWSTVWFLTGGRIGVPRNRSHSEVRGPLDQGPDPRDSCETRARSWREAAGALVRQLLASISPGYRGSLAAQVLDLAFKLHYEGQRFRSLPQTAFSHRLFSIVEVQ